LSVMTTIRPRPLAQASARVPSLVASSWRRQRPLVAGSSGAVARTGAVVEAGEQLDADDDAARVRSIRCHVRAMHQRDGAVTHPQGAGGRCRRAILCCTAARIAAGGPAPAGGTTRHLSLVETSDLAQPWALSGVIRGVSDGRSQWCPRHGDDLSVITA
jgi:hypothetical protein